MIEVVKVTLTYDLPDISANAACSGPFCHKGKVSACLNTWREYKPVPSRTFITKEVSSVSQNSATFIRNKISQAAFLSCLIQRFVTISHLCRCLFFHSISAPFSRVRNFLGARSSLTRIIPPWSCVVRLEKRSDWAIFSPIKPSFFLFPARLTRDEKKKTKNMRLRCCAYFLPYKHSSWILHMRTSLTKCCCFFILSFSRA